MDRAGNRISKIIQGLKDFARKTGPGEARLVSLDECAAKALDLVGSTARKSGMTLSLEAGKDLPTIKADPVHVEQIILNLLINAMQAITHDHGKISVITGFQKERRRVFVSVEDNGSGIDPGTHFKIFDPFFTTRQAEGGTGLGLAVTYSMVKAHGGDIDFMSEKGKGTTFTVTFPTAPEIRPIRILVAEDEESLRDIIVYTLERAQGYSVEQASTGAEALLKIGTFRPDLVILDVFMPDTDGLEVCRALRKDPRLSGIKVIIITAYADDPKLDQIKRLGFKRILEKPLRLDDLLNQARETLGEGAGEQGIGSRQ
jgi:CheY-like chemotaxis protein